MLIFLNFEFFKEVHKVNDNFIKKNNFFNFYFLHTEIADIAEMESVISTEAE